MLAEDQSDTTIECPWKRASNWARGRGPTKVGPMSQPRRYHRSRVVHAGSYLHTVCAFLLPMLL